CAVGGHGRGPCTVGDGGDGSVVEQGRDLVAGDEGGVLMLSLEFIRANPDAVRRAGELKGEAAPVDEILELDRVWREHQHVAEKARAQQNDLSKRFAQSRDQTDLANAKQVGEESKREMAEADRIKRELDDLLLQVPNLFHESVPI